MKKERETRKRKWEDKHEDRGKMKSWRPNGCKQEKKIVKVEGKVYRAGKQTQCINRSSFLIRRGKPAKGVQT